MRKLIVKLVATLLGMPACLLLTGISGNGIFVLGSVACLLFSILLWKDLGQAFRNTDNPSHLTRVFGILMGVPQALFGLASVAIGLSIILWVLYNSFFGTDPNYSGGLLSFGIGPLLVMFGLAWIASAFRRDGA